MTRDQSLEEEGPRGNAHDEQHENDDDTEDDGAGVVWCVNNIVTLCLFKAVSKDKQWQGHVCGQIAHGDMMQKRFEPYNLYFDTRLHLLAGISCTNCKGAFLRRRNTRISPSCREEDCSTL